jgi:hypothetical protein
MLSGNVYRKSSFSRRIREKLADQAGRFKQAIADTRKEDVA